MSISTIDIVPISEARARLTELAEEVARDGSEKLLTRNGVGLVALIDAKRLDYYHGLEAEQFQLDLLIDAQRGLEDILAGRTMTGEELRARLALPASNKS